MVNARHKEVLKALTSKGVVSSTSDADLVTVIMDLLLAPRTSTLEEVIQKELEEFKKEGIMRDFRNEMATYHDLTACDVPKFYGTLDLIASTRWLSDIEVLPILVIVKKRTKLLLPQIFFVIMLRCGGMERFVKKKFNDLILYCPEYHGYKKLKVKRFQRMLLADIWEVISPFKCTTLEDLLSRAWVTKAYLQRKKSKEVKETKRKLEFRDIDVKKPKHDHGQKGGGNQTKTPCKKCHKFYLGECRANLSGCYKCDTLNHMSKDYKKPMILCYNFNQLEHNLNECPNPKVTEAKLLKSIKEEKVEKTRVLTQKLVKTLSTPLNKLPFSLEVEIEDSKVIVMSNVYREVEIEIDDSIFRIDLALIMIGVFDIVIGMDWLDKYNATILCSQKLVRVVNPQGHEIIIYGDKRKAAFKLYFVIKARKYLSCGCYALMAHVIDTIFEEKSVKYVPVVNEFLDFFSKICRISRRPIEFKVGDFIMLKVSSWKGVFRFKNKGKLSLSFIGPFKILKIVREVSYILELPKEIRVKVQQKHHKGTSIRREPDDKMRISELPKVSLVNASLKKLKFYLAQFDSVVKKMTTPNARTE
nr:hypothetical protein [Tanacetum cinerariifolium]